MLKQSLFAVMLTGSLVLGVAAHQAPPPAGSGQQPVSTQDEAAAEGRAVLDRGLAKFGTRADLDAIKSLHFNVRAVQQSAMGGPALSSIAATCVQPRKVHLRAEFEGGESAQLIHNGEHTWATEPGEDGFDIAPSQDVQTMFLLMVPAAYMLSVAKDLEVLSVRRAEFHGKPCHRLELRDRKTTGTFTAFFNAQDDKLEGFNIAMDPTGMFTAQILLDEYREFGDLTLPTVSRMVIDGATEMSFRAEAFQTNQEVRDDLFAMPDEVRRQLDQSTAPPAAQDDR